METNTLEGKMQSINRPLQSAVTSLPWHTAGKEEGYTSWSECGKERYTHTSVLAM